MEKFSEQKSVDDSCSGKKYPDGGYGWIIVFLSFLLYLIADGIAYSLGLLNSVWLEFFKESETKTSWIGSIFYAMPLLSGPIMSKLVDRYGCKKMTMIGGAVSSFGFIISSLCISIEQLYLTVGIIGGSGLSAAYISGLVTVERWFEARRSLAIGIVSAGTGFGTFVLSPITKFCLDKLDWQSTVLILSVVLALMTIIGVFLDDPPWKIKENEKKLESKVNSEKISLSLDFSLFRDRNFTLLAAATFIIYAFFNTAIFFLPELLKSSIQEGVTYTSVTGIGLMIGMVSLGWCADLKTTNVVYLNAACFLICGISEALMPLAVSSTILLSITCTVFGFSFASAYVLIPKLVELIVGVDNFTSAIGLNFFMQGLGMLVGTPFASWIYGMSGSWSLSFYVSGLVIASSFGLVIFIKLNKTNEVQPNKSEA